MRISKIIILILSIILVIKNYNNKVFISIISNDINKQESTIINYDKNLKKVKKQTLHKKIINENNFNDERYSNKKIIITNETNISLIDIDKLKLKKLIESETSINFIYHTKKAIYYSYNLVNDNYLIKYNIKTKQSRMIKNIGFINNALTINNKVYLFCNKETHYIKELDSNNKIKLNYDLDYATNPVSYQNDIYYLSKNKLIKIDTTTLKQTYTTIKLDNPAKLKVSKSNLYIQNKKQLIKINLNTAKHKIYNFDVEIVDYDVYDSTIVLLSNKDIRVYDLSVKIDKQISHQYNGVFNVLIQ